MSRRSSNESGSGSVNHHLNDSNQSGRFGGGGGGEEDDLPFLRKSSLCVNELRLELHENDLDVDGSKEVLISRLQQMRLSECQERASSRSSRCSSSSSARTQSSSSSIADCSVETQESSERRFRR
jgi:hypothetical protein